MIAITSHKPFNSDPHYGSLQKLALESWIPNFERVIYLGDHDGRLDNDKVMFAKSEPFPKIKQISEIAAALNRPVAIINSDIVLTADFAKVKKMFESSNFLFGTSKRLEFNDKVPRGTLVDHGLDIFLGKPDYWKAVARNCPEQLRMGHPLWDTWLIGFLNVKFKDKVCDFSGFKCVLHPKHEGRNYSHAIHLNDEYIKKAGMPGQKLK